MTIRYLISLTSLLATAASAHSAEKLPAEPARAIFVMRRDGTDVRRLVFIESYPQLGAPRFSHDGQWLAFEARGPRPARALTIDTGGRNLSDLGAGIRPDWSPDDKQIVFEKPGAEQSSVWVQNADGRGTSWLTHGGAPRWSPDGSQILLSSPLRIFDVVTGEARPILEVDKLAAQSQDYDWSPDGKRLAVVVNRPARRQLLLVDLEGSPTRVSIRLEADIQGPPCWSPDGEHLALAIRDAESGTSRVHLLEVASRAPAQLIPNQQGDNVNPAFSPDGASLAFASTRAEPAE